MNEPWVFDVQLFSADPDVDVGDDPDTTTETPPDDETPEAKATRLEKSNQELQGRLNTFGAVIEELRNRPAERIIERERAPERQEGLTEAERAERNARLAVALATEPDKVIEELSTRVEARTAQRIMGDVGDVAADAVIDRFLRKQESENPILNPKIEKIFRKAIDDMGPQVKAKLLTVPPEIREQLLVKEYKAAAGDYLIPLARAKIKPGVGTDTGGRGAAVMPDQPAPDGKFRFTASQREAMKRSGFDDKRIADREKAIQMGVA